MFEFGLPEGELTRSVRAYATERGVSERTVWRWVKRARAEGDWTIPPAQRDCQVCGNPLPYSATIRRRFCLGSSCRVSAFRGSVPPRRRASTSTAESAHQRAVQTLLALLEEATERSEREERRKRRQK